MGQYPFFQTWNFDKLLRWFERSHQSSVIPEVFEKNWEDVEGQFELQNSGLSEVGFGRPTLCLSTSPSARTLAPPNWWIRRAAYCGVPGKEEMLDEHQVFFLCLS
jgi:hypothetical protein